MSKRLAIVVPRCADAAYGGAEVLALALARDLHGRHDVEILTTCATDYWTWENVLPPGLGELDGIAVRRFAVDAPRNLTEFNRLSRSFRYRIGSLSVSEQEQWIRAQGPYSTPLLRHLSHERAAYDAFIFMPYLYASTYFGLPLVRDRAILVPLAHEEWPLYLPVWQHFVRDVRAFAFVSPEERELLQRRFRAETIAGEIVHPRLVPSTLPTGAAPNAPEHPFMLFVGRIDESKGLLELLDFFSAHLSAHPSSPWRLALAGPEPPPTAQHERVQWIGAVDETTKWALLRAADLFVMPSYHESLSIATLEAWRAGRAALVNGWNAVLVGQARRANAGLWYYDQRSFDACLGALDGPTRAQLGEQGCAYVEAAYVRGDTREMFERTLLKLG